MKKDKIKDEMRAEYKRKDLAKGIRGKYFKEYQESHNVVLLKPEVAKIFPNEKAVNDALLSLIKVAKSSVSQSKVQIK